MRPSSGPPVLPAEKAATQRPLPIPGLVIVICLILGGKDGFLRCHGGHQNHPGPKFCISNWKQTTFPQTHQSSKLAPGHYGAQSSPPHPRHSWSQRPEPPFSTGGSPLVEPCCSFLPAGLTSVGMGSHSPSLWGPLCSCGPHRADLREGPPSRPPSMKSHVHRVNIGSRVTPCPPPLAMKKHLATLVINLTAVQKGKRRWVDLLCSK